MSTGRTPECMFITSASADHGDLLALRAAAYLHRARELEIACVVANGWPAREFASAAKNAVGKLAPVGVGSRVGDPSEPHRLDKRFASEPDSRDGQELLQETLESARDQIDVILTSPFTDAAELARKHRRLFAERVRHVTILGGVNGADPAPNNRLDFGHAIDLYVFLRHQRIPTSLIPPDTVLAHTVPVGVMRELAERGDERAVWLAETALARVERRWRAAHDLRRVPGRQRPVTVRELFLRDWVAVERRGEAEELGPDDSILDLVRGIPVGSLLALIEALRFARREPEIFAMEGEPLRVCRAGGESEIAALVDRQVALLRRALLDGRGQ